MSQTAPQENNRKPGPAWGRRVVVTGMGTINPLAHTLEDFWAGLERGESAVRRIAAFDPSEYASQVAAEVKGFDPGKFIGAKEARRMSRVSQLAIAAAKLAVADAGLTIPEDDAGDYGIILGTGNSAFPEIEDEAQTFFEKGGRRISPFFLPTILPNMCTAQVAMHLGLEGYNSTVITACASGTQSIGDAAEVIKRGAAEVMLAGGADASISELGLAGFCSMRAMSSHYNETPEKASRPFDSARDGFVPAEGAALLVLESLDHALARGARIYAEVVGFGSSCDAYHLTDPEPTGAGVGRAMRQAFRYRLHKCPCYRHQGRCDGDPGHQEDFRGGHKKYPGQCHQVDAGPSFWGGGRRGSDCDHPANATPDGPPDHQPGESRPPV